MKTRMLITLVLAGAAVLFTCGCPQPVEKVVQSQTERNWLGAAPSAISSATEPIEPKILPKTHFAAALLFEQQGQIEKAVIQYRKAVAVNHQYLEAYNRLGILLGRLGRHGDAETALGQAVELKPDSPALRNNLGYEYALQRRWTDAEVEFNNAIRLDPGFARAYVNLGMVLAKQQRFEEALEAFHAVLPEADAYYNLGLVFGGQHRYHDAADAFRHVLALNPEFSAAGVQLERLAPRLEVDTPLEPVTDLHPVVARAEAAEAPSPAPPPTVTESPPAHGEPTVATEDDHQPVVMLAEAVTQMSSDDTDKMISAERDMGFCADEDRNMTREELIDDDHVDQSVGDGAYVLAEMSADTTGPVASPADQPPATTPTQVSQVEPPIITIVPAPAEDVPAEFTGAETELHSSEADWESALTLWWVIEDLIDRLVVDQSLDHGDYVVAETSSDTAGLADSPSDQPLAMMPMQAGEDRPPIASVPLLPVEDVLAELTGAETELHSSEADREDDPTPWWVTYDACTFTDDNAWLAVYAPSVPAPGPLAPAWYAPPPLVMPTTTDQTIDDWTAGGWFADLDLLPGQYQPKAHPMARRRPPPFYPPAPELTPDEFVDWTEPCPPDGTGF